MQKENSIMEKESQIQSLEKTLGSSKQTSQGALYEKDQEISNLKLQLEKVFMKSNLFYQLYYVALEGSET